MEKEGVAPEQISELMPQRAFAGNQPSSTLLLGSLEPATLGSLIALYEHKVFVQGVVWGLIRLTSGGLNWGKRVAHRILPAMHDPSWRNRSTHRHKGCYRSAVSFSYKSDGSHCPCLIADPDIVFP